MALYERPSAELKRRLDAIVNKIVNSLVDTYGKEYVHEALKHVTGEEDPAKAVEKLKDVLISVGTSGGDRAAVILPSEMAAHMYSGEKENIVEKALSKYLGAFVNWLKAKREGKEEEAYRMYPGAYSPHKIYDAGEVATLLTSGHPDFHISLTPRSRLVLVGAGGHHVGKSRTHLPVHVAFGFPTMMPTLGLLGKQIHLHTATEGLHGKLPVLPPDPRLAKEMVENHYGLLFLELPKDREITLVHSPSGPSIRIGEKRVSLVSSPSQVGDIIKTFPSLVRQQLEGGKTYLVGMLGPEDRQIAPVAYSSLPGGRIFPNTFSLVYVPPFMNEKNPFVVYYHPLKTDWLEIGYPRELKREGNAYYDAEKRRFIVGGREIKPGNYILEYSRLYPFGKRIEPTYTIVTPPGNVVVGENEVGMHHTGGGDSSGTWENFSLQKEKELARKWSESNPPRVHELGELLQEGYEVLRLDGVPYYSLGFVSHNMVPFLRRNGWDIGMVFERRKREPPKIPFFRVPLSAETRRSDLKRALLPF